MIPKYMVSGDLGGWDDESLEVGRGGRSEIDLGLLD